MLDLIFSDNREYAAAAPAAKRNEGKIVAVIGAVVDVQVSCDRWQDLKKNIFVKNAENGLF
jgi:hypothetical protein